MEWIQKKQEWNQMSTLPGSSHIWHDISEGAVSETRIPKSPRLHAHPMEVCTLVLGKPHPGPLWNITRERSELVRTCSTRGRLAFVKPNPVLTLLSTSFALGYLQIPATTATGGILISPWQSDDPTCLTCNPATLPFSSTPCKYVWRQLSQNGCIPEQGSLETWPSFKCGRCPANVNKLKIAKTLTFLGQAINVSNVFKCCVAILVFSKHDKRTWASIPPSNQQFINVHSKRSKQIRWSSWIVALPSSWSPAHES